MDVTVIFSIDVYAGYSHVQASLHNQLVTSFNTLLKMLLLLFEMQLFSFIYLHIPQIIPITLSVTIVKNESMSLYIFFWLNRVL